MASLAFTSKWNCGWGKNGLRVFRNFHFFNKAIIIRAGECRFKEKYELFWVSASDTQRGPNAFGILASLSYPLVISLNFSNHHLQEKENLPKLYLQLSSLKHPPSFSSFPQDTLSSISLSCSNTKCSQGNLCAFGSNSCVYHLVCHHHRHPMRQAQNHGAAPWVPWPVATACTCHFGPSLPLVLLTPDEVLLESWAFLMGSLSFVYSSPFLYLETPFTVL